MNDDEFKPLERGPRDGERPVSEVIRSVAES